ncbi:MAG: hypothetical protein E7317_08870 [Clostridiales bacterium]|nr:hypothetical protein [Clostridiales bacterium]
MNNQSESRKSAFMSHMTERAGARELSDSRYNMVIGLMLVWGFGLNALMIRFLGFSIIDFVYRNAEHYTAIVVGFLVAYFALCFGGSALLRSENPAVCFLGYNMIAVPIGILLTISVISVGDFSIVYRAALYTAIITLIMLIVSTAVPHLFQNIGGGLGVALLATIVVELAATFIFHADLVIVDYIVIGIMSLYVGFDWARANQVQRTTTNAIAAASALYLDIVNIFIRILSILSKSKSRD